MKFLNCDNDNHDDDYDDDDSDNDHVDAKELFLKYGWPMKLFKSYFQLAPLSEILTIVSVRHTHHEHDLDLRRTWDQALLSKVAQ